MLFYLAAILFIIFIITASLYNIKEKSDENTGIALTASALFITSSMLFVIAFLGFMSINIERVELEHRMEVNDQRDTQLLADIQDYNINVWFYDIKAEPLYYDERYYTERR